MDEKKVPEGWAKVDRGRIVFDDDGRMKILSTCKCGGPVWVKQGKVFKKWFTGRCSSCGTMVIARIRKVTVSHDEAMEDESRIRDIDALVSHLTDVAVREIDPVMYDAAEMLMELNEKNWSECLQIAQYDEQ